MTPHQREVVLDAYANGESTLWLKRSDVIDRMEAAGYLDGYHVTPAGAEAAGIAWADFLVRLHGDALADLNQEYPAADEVAWLREMLHDLDGTAGLLMKSLDRIERALRATK